jgi:hypothetical protein
MLTAAAAAGAGAAAGAALASHSTKVDQTQDVDVSREIQEEPFGTKDDYRRDSLDTFEQGMYMNGGKGMLTPPMEKGEEHNPEAPISYSPALTPDHRSKGVGLFGDAGMNEIMGGDDPFAGTTHMRHLSGNSHGMPSPLYDSSTGRGMDRIQSKDIVALMDHVCILRFIWSRTLLIIY